MNETDNIVDMLEISKKDRDEQKRRSNNQSSFEERYGDPDIISEEVSSIGPVTYIGLWKAADSSKRILSCRSSRKDFWPVYDVKLLSNEEVEAIVKLHNEWLEEKSTESQNES